jgi:RNA polymerase sigma-70 factor, ECF subfamily
MRTNGSGSGWILDPFSAICSTEAMEPEQQKAGVEDPFEARAIERVRRGETEAYSFLVEKYMRRVMSVVWGIVRNGADAEELTQEAFVRAYEKFHLFRAGAPFGPWVYRIAKNLALDVMKHRRRFPTEPIEALPPARVAVDPEVGGREKARRIDAAIESLPEMQRLVARLFLVEQLDHAEIARVLDLSEGTVRSHLSLARKKLKQMLADVYEGAR